jgi:hypothetical protein
MQDMQDQQAQDYIEEIIMQLEHVNQNTFTKHFVSTRAKYKVWSQNKHKKIGSKTIEEWYVVYLRERANILREGRMEDWVMGKHAKLPIAFKSKSKVQSLLADGYIDAKTDRVIQRFPLASNTTKYSLHHVAPPNTWLVDVVFFGRFAYYAFININTRYLQVYPANSRISGTAVEVFAAAKEATGTDTYAMVLEEFLPYRRGARLRGDAEGAFSTPDTRVRSLYRQFGASFESIPRLALNTRRKQKTAPHHSSLAILDSVIRTLRDMAYNVGLDDSVNPIDMAELVQQYNVATHSTLTKYGPSFPVSPEMVQNDKHLEDYICRRVSQENMFVRQQRDFLLPIGSKVMAYNDIAKMDKRRSSTRDELCVITGFEHGRYQVRGERSGVILTLPRWKLRPVENAK